MEAAITYLKTIKRTKARVLDLLGDGVPERDIIALPGMPDRVTIAEWRTDPGFDRAFEFCRNEGYHELGAKLVEDVDEATLTLGADAGRELFERRKRELAAAHPDVFGDDE